jgi:hypothetical protein
VLELVSKILFRVQKADPQGLKPAFLAGLGGTAEAVPCPKPFRRPVLVTIVEVRVRASAKATKNQRMN